MGRFNWYSVGENGTILYTSNGGVSSIEDELPIVSDLKLEQNYPNPFNPTTKIKFTIPQSPLPGGNGRGGLVILKVYDILGNEIATLVNEELSPGEYEAEFSPESIIKYPATAIYFYTLRAGDPSQAQGWDLFKQKR